MSLSTFLALSLLIFLAPQAPAFFSPAIPFYRSPQSQFPSGQAPADLLQRYEKGLLTQNFYLVRKDRREYRLPSEQVLRDLDLSLRAVNIASGTVGIIANARPPWYEWVSPEGAHQWIAAENLAPDPSDLGLAQAIEKEGIHQTPNAKSEEVFEAAAGSRYQVLGFESDFVLVQSLERSEVRGFLPLKSVLLKVDFANYVMNKSGEWHSVVFREGATLGNVAALLTQPARGIVASAVPEQGLVPRSVVDLKKTEWVQWAESELRGHGRIFWKKQEHVDQNGPRTDVFSTEEILAKRFVSVATHPLHPEEAIVSGDGVYWTADGKSWVKLPNFPHEDLPVSINSKGDLFVGGFVSRDQGQTFHPFLRWQDLTPFLETRRKLPGLLRLAEIKTPAPEKIEISLDTGASKVRLTGSNRYGLVTDWKVVQ